MQRFYIIRINMKLIYMDHNATTPVDTEVVNAMMPFLREIYGNPSSLHYFGQQSKKFLESARINTAKLFNLQTPKNIIFTSCGTESNNMAIKGAAFANKDTKNHIITTKTEHHAILEPCAYLTKYFGFKITYLPVDGYGLVNPDDVKKAITPKTVLISIMHANNETGVIQPLQEISGIAKEYGVLFHTDAVQTAGKIPIDINKLGVDLLSISGHKIYAPKGIGALYLRTDSKSIVSAKQSKIEDIIYTTKKTKMHQLIHGGSHESGRRAGTENVPYIVGLGKACEIAAKNMAKENERLLKLRNKLEQGIKTLISKSNINGHPDKRLSNTSNISFEGIESEGLLFLLDKEGFAVSAGSACTSGKQESSHVLAAMGIPPITAQGTIRVSLGHQNTEQDIDDLLHILPKTVAKLRSISPLWNK